MELMLPRSINVAERRYAGVARGSNCAILRIFLPGNLQLASSHPFDVPRIPPIKPVRNTRLNVPCTCCVPSIPKLTDPLIRPIKPSELSPSSGRRAKTARIIAIRLRITLPGYLGNL